MLQNQSNLHQNHPKTAKKPLPPTVLRHSTAATAKCAAEHRAARATATQPQPFFFFFFFLWGVLYEKSEKTEKKTRENREKTDKIEIFSRKISIKIFKKLLLINIFFVSALIFLK
jgi:hypothetical protein